MKNQQDVCCSSIVHQDAVSIAKEQLPSDETIYDLADFYKTFGDSTRIKIICALLETELCVCDLTNVINTSQSAQNIIFALGVKILFLILGAFGIATMWEAVIADVGVSLIAILNAMRV